MNTVIRHIEYLISRNDCVIIPTFGALIASTKSAVICPEDSMILPPSRNLTFNAEIIDNDGRLANSIARAEQISYEAARYKMQNGIDAMVKYLHLKGELTLGKIGKFTYNDIDDTVEFFPTPDKMLSVQTLWLEPVKIQTEEIKEQEEYIRIKKFVLPSFAKRAARYAASIAILIFASFLLSTPLTVDDAMLASFAPEFRAVETEAPEPEPTQLTINTAHTYSAESQISAREEAPNLTAAHAAYHVVVATFAGIEAAREYVNQHSDVNLEIIKNGKYYSVTICALPSMQEAAKEAMRISGSYPGAWVCKK